MINFQAYFEDNYQQYLKDIDYKTITVGSVIEKINVQLKDELNFSVDRENKSFDFEVRRTVFFTPNALYQLTIAFGAKLIIRENAPDLNSVDWNDEFKNNPICIGLIQGLMSRISVLISHITSSYGQNPMVTPPSFLR